MMNRMLMYATLCLFLLCASLARADEQEELRTRGILAFYTGDFETASASFQQILKFNPLSIESWTNLGVSYEKQGKIDKAKETYKECIKVLPKDVTCYNFQCTLAFLTSNQVADYEICLAAVRLNPKDLAALRNVGSLFVLLLDYEKAIPFLETAVSLAAENVDEHTLHNLCLAYSRAGVCEKAITCGQTLVQKFPDSNTYSALGISASVCSYTDPHGIVARTEACRFAGKEQTTANCPSGYSTHLDYENAGKVYALVQPGGETYPNYALPPHLHTFIERRVSIIHLSDVIIEAPSGIISKDCDLYTGDHLFNSKIPEEFYGTTSNLEFLDYPVAFAVQQNAGNYYHALAETLGRILLLRNNALTNDNSLGIKKLVLPIAGKSLLEQALDLLNAKQQQKWPPTGVEIVWYDGSHPLNVKDLYVADWRVPDLTTIHDSWLPFFPARYVLRLTSSTMREASARQDGVELLPLGSADWRVVYISRTDAGVRTLKPSEDGLISKLQLALGKRLVVFKGAGMSVADQLATFRNAAIIFGPHGAGFTNMMWAPQGASVILFPMTPVSDICFAHMALALGHEYSEVSSVQSYYYGDYHIDETKEQDIVNAVLSEVSRKNLKL